MPLFGKRKDGQTYPKTYKKPVTGINTKKESGGIAKRLLFGSKPNEKKKDVITFNQPEKLDTMSVGRELIRISDEAKESLGVEAGSDFDANEKLNSKFTRIIMNSKIPLELYTPEVQSYLADRNRHDLNRVLKNITNNRNRDVTSDLWMKDYPNAKPSVFGRDTNPDM